jgi:hypothetical protein
MLYYMMMYYIILHLLKQIIIGLIYIYTYIYIMDMIYGLEAADPWLGPDLSGGQPGGAR